jgi:hypothetical protein
MARHQPGFVLKAYLPHIRLMMRTATWPAKPSSQLRPSPASGHARGGANENPVVIPQVEYTMVMANFWQTTRVFFGVGCVLVFLLWAVRARNWHIRNTRLIPVVEQYTQVTTINWKFMVSSCWVAGGCLFGRGKGRGGSCHVWVALDGWSLKSIVECGAGESRREVPRLGMDHVSCRVGW